MRHIKHYCKLIISTLAVVLVFAYCSIVAHADPLSAAMIGASSGMGFGWGAFAGMPPSTAIDYAERANYDGFSNWTDLTGDGVYIRIDRGEEKDKVTFGPDISQASYDRARVFANTFGLNPGEVHNFGNVYSINGYYFSQQISSSYYKGPIIGYFDGVTTHMGIASDIYIDNIIYNSNLAPTGSSYKVGTKTGTNNIGSSLKNAGVWIQISTSGSRSLSFYAKNPITGADNPILQITGLNSYYPTAFDTDSISVSRSADSDILNPNSGSYQFDIPHGALDSTGAQTGVDLTDKSLLQQILEKVEELAADDDISDLIVIQPTPPTPTDDTVGNTLWVDFTDFFVESFGDIFDGINDFKESFGDWVNDVATGWTEVFGDIYSDLHDFKESFGDWVDDVATGWTEVFGDINSTLSGTISNYLSTISSAVQSLVNTIENVDYQFIDAFWKNFLTPFTGLFNSIKSHLSIWHYVVEWLASISSVFTFYLGVFSGAGYSFLLPIYACFAGTVVIAVYRRFGK